MVRKAPKMLRLGKRVQDITNFPVDGEIQGGFTTSHISPLLWMSYIMLLTISDIN